MELILDNNKLKLENLNDDANPLSMLDIIRIEQSGVFNGNRISKPSERFGIDFSLAEFTSTIKAVIYIPTEKAGASPVCQYYVMDPSNAYHAVASIEGDYAIADNLFLPLDDLQVDDIISIIGTSKSEAIGYSKVARIIKEKSPYIEIRKSNSEAANISSVLPHGSVRDCLYDYQCKGVDWMNLVISEDIGFVLADEMGLGKTIQVIAVIEEQKNKGPSLLIAPNSLLVNWEREIATFAKGNIEFYVDIGKKRQQRWQVLEKHELVITSYDIAYRDFSVFEQINWNLIILDEAQYIKNFKTKRSKTIKDFKKRSGIAITGTPFENRLTDIWSIYDFCFQGLLGDVSQFKSHYTDGNISELEQVIRPLMLRRRVEEVRKDLPEKIITPVALSMLSDESEGYDRYRKEFLNEYGGQLKAITELSKYCALPSLLDKDLQFYAPSSYSAKFSYLFDSLLDVIKEAGQKVLIFTRWRAAQDAIKREIESRYGAYCRILNGDVKTEERQEIIDEFSDQCGFSVLVLNPTVAGVGLNITAANHVIFYTLEWNPALEDQCIARAARIKQKNTVFVYRLFYADTIEDEINSCLAGKRQIFKDVIIGSEATKKPDISRALQLSPFVGGIYE